MPDWKQIVRKNLRVLISCSPDAAEPIVEELASHLEDTYEHCRRLGLDEVQALERALQELNRSRMKLAQRLLQENLMRGFAHRIILPGLATFVLTMTVAWSLKIAHVRLTTVVLPNDMFLYLPIPWFCLLPLCGADGAVLSRRRGGSRLHCMLTATFPAMILASAATLFFLGLVVMSALASDAGWKLLGAVPGLALLLVIYVSLTALPLAMGAAIADRFRHTHTDLA